MQTIVPHQAKIRPVDTSKTVNSRLTHVHSKVRTTYWFRGYKRRTLQYLWSGYLLFFQAATSALQALAICCMLLYIWYTRVKYGMQLKFENNIKQIFIVMLLIFFINIKGQNKHERKEAFFPPCCFSFKLTAAPVNTLKTKLYFKVQTTHNYYLQFFSFKNLQMLIAAFMYAPQ